MKVSGIDLNKGEEPEIVFYINGIKYVRQDELNELMLKIKELEILLTRLNQVVKII